MTHRPDAIGTGKIGTGTIGTGGGVRDGQGRGQTPIAGPQQPDRSAILRMHYSAFDGTAFAREGHHCWRDRARDPGLDSIHDLRHPAASKIVEAGETDKEEKAISGHMTKKMFEHYSASTWQRARARVANGTRTEHECAAGPVASAFRRGPERRQVLKSFGGEYRNRTGVHGFAIRCVTTPPTRRSPCAYCFS